MSQIVPSEEPAETVNMVFVKPFLSKKTPVRNLPDPFAMDTNPTTKAAKVAVMLKDETRYSCSQDHASQTEGKHHKSRYHSLSPK